MQKRRELLPLVAEAIKQKVRRAAKFHEYWIRINDQRSLVGGCQYKELMKNFENTRFNVVVVLEKS